MSNQETFNDLFSCIKILERNQLTIPSVGFQRKYNLTKKFLEDEKFGLIINRKGHLNAENLTYIMSSKTYGGILVRLDISGAPHSNPGYIDIPTPHLHIFDDDHGNGTIAYPLDSYEIFSLIEELCDSLHAFLSYNNVNTNGLTICDTLV